MNALKVSKIPSVFTSLLYICGFFIFLEWLYPIKQITETNEMGLFIVFAGFCFLISLLEVRWWLSFILKGAGILFIIHVLFYEQSLLDIAWVHDFVIDILYNWQALTNQEWYELTAIFRSLLFLILIWLMSYLIHYWFVTIKRIFLFILLTFVYLSVLDTFTVYDATMSIIRVFILSFLSLGLTNFFNEVEREVVPFKWTKRMSRWLIPILSIVLLSSVVGYAAPKFSPQWPDPVPFIQHATGTGGSGKTIQKVGYGEDDSHLGGSFVQDNARVFTAIAPTENYWRIETKDVYTGKGWEAEPDETKETYMLDSLNNIPINTFSDDVETQKLQARIEMDAATYLPKLVYPYGIREVLAERGFDIELNMHSDELRTMYSGKDTSLADYNIIYDDPSFDIDELKNDGDDPVEISSRYTQVPDDLPERVGQLAEDITEPYDNRYDKAKAIEQHFGQSGEFTYETEDIPVPKGDEDYVDQFLFDSKKGYCDNYSTSMVVMLRTQGIPARWAKGFTSGNRVVNEDNDRISPDGSDVYEVTNANAHSWVEVYFPDTGWVPFEPTQGFSNLADFHTEVAGSDEDDALDANEAEGPETETEDDPEVEEDDPEIGGPEYEEDDEDKDDVASGFTLKKWHIGVGGGLFGLLLVFAFVKRYRIEAYLLAKKMEREGDAASLQSAYHFLLKILTKKGNGKDPQQTLREYAKEIDVLYSGSSMSLLTAGYEQILYNNNKEVLNNTELPELWKDLVNQVIG